MARIRTIKPEYFLHDGLFDLEHETGLPIRVAYIGLWTQADREGRFEWRPRRLKAAILPYDEVEFSRVLDALVTRGFLVRYASGTREFGAILSWKKHQAINNRESASEIPPPLETTSKPVENTEPLTRAPRVDDACPTREVHARAEGKGREGKGIKTKDGANSSTRLPSDWPDAFNEFWHAYPSRGRATNPKKPARDKFARLVRDGTDPAALIAGARGYAAAMQELGKAGTEGVKQALSWLNAELWEQYQDTGTPTNGTAMGPLFDEAFRRAQYAAQFPGGEADQSVVDRLLARRREADVEGGEAEARRYLERGGDAP